VTVLRPLILKALPILLLILIVQAGSHAQVSHGNIASSCTNCHAAQSADQPQTPMGRALQFSETDPLFNTHPVLTFRKGPYTYTVETKENNKIYSVTDGTRTISLPIPWSFGQGAQTWVLEVNGELYESMVSYYPSIDGLEITTGDEGLKPASLDEAVGRKLLKTEPKDCFGCHSTNAVANGKLYLETMEPGVNCEHCHTGAVAHMIAGVQGKAYETAPPDLGKFTSEDMSNFCGRCHRTWATVVRSGSQGPVDVRFQPYRLANSKCFDGIDPRISCLACHDPHKDLVKSTSYYDGKCLACHALKNSAPPKNAPSDAKACPVATANCVSCHMPEVKLPNGLVTFHDHEIRIVKPGSVYPN
jgi:hypothetical protein